MIEAGDLSAPNISIRQFERCAYVEADVIDDPIEIPLAPQAKVHAAVTRFATQLERVRPSSLPTSATDANEFLLTGAKLAQNCFNESREKPYHKLASAIRAISDQVAQCSELSEPLTAEIVVHEGDYLPWEWLGSVEDDSSGQHVRERIGLAGVCWRASSDRRDNTYLRAEPLQIRMFRHRDLLATREEEAFFKFEGGFRLIGPIPETDTSDVSLAAHLADPRHPFNDVTPAEADQVVHIACHHDLAEGLDMSDVRSLPFLDSVLRFGSRDGQFVNVRDLGNELLDLLLPKSHDERGAQFVFINACRGEFHPYAATSVVQIMLDYICSGVAGTIVNVPDVVAALMSREFYRALLSRRTVAEALLTAKLEVLQTTGSPLGMLYTYTGIPSLRMS